jgi:hypothetical protein
MSPNRLNNDLSPRADGFQEPNSLRKVDSHNVVPNYQGPEKQINTDKNQQPTVDSNGFANAVFTFDDEPKPEQRVRGRRERNKSQDSKNTWQDTMSNSSTMNRSASLDRLGTNERPTRPADLARVNFTNQLASYQTRPEMSSPSLNDVPVSMPRINVSRDPYDVNKATEYVKEIPNYDSYRRPTEFGRAPSYSGYDGRPIAYDDDFPAQSAYNNVQSASPPMPYAADRLPPHYPNHGSLDRYDNIPGQGQYGYERLASPTQYVVDRPYDRYDDRGIQMPQLAIQRPDLSFDLASRPTSRSDRQPAGGGYQGQGSYDSVEDNYDYDRRGGDRAFDVGSGVGSPREMSFRSNQMLDILGASASVDV